MVVREIAHIAGIVALIMVCAAVIVGALLLLAALIEAAVTFIAAHPVDSRTGGAVVAAMLAIGLVVVMEDRS